MNATEQPTQATALIRLPQVLGRFPISKSAWYLGIKEGRFPKGIKIGANSTAWRSSDITALINQLSEQAEG